MATLPISNIINLDGTPEDHKLEYDYKRDVDKRRKYALGVWEREPLRPNKPKMPISQRYARSDRAANNKIHNSTAAQLKQLGKHPVLNTGDLSSDSSAEEDVVEASAAPAPDAGITYSFDAQRGPARGSQVLSMAISKAVERFETRETENLVKNEYEVIGKEADRGQQGYAADDDEDEYELV